ncbi:hypothetical protein J0H58_07760 [bacterium]|nr:hypothetical protein [bacterium]
MVGGGHVPPPGEISIELRTQAEHIGTLKVHQIAAVRFHHRVLPQTFIVPVKAAVRPPMPGGSTNRRPGADPFRTRPVLYPNLGTRGDRPATVIPHPTGGGAATGEVPADPRKCARTNKPAPPVGSNSLSHARPQALGGTMPRKTLDEARAPGCD